MAGISAAIGRLSQREKIMVTVLGVVLVILMFFFINLWLTSAVDELEENVATEQRSLRAIYGAADDYVTAQKTYERDLASASNNEKLNLTEKLAGLAKQISFEAVDSRNQPQGKKRLESFLDFAPPKDTELAKNRSRRNKKERDPLEGYHRRDLEVSVRDNVTFAALYEFMEKVEDSTDQLFVTEVRIESNKRNTERSGRGKIVVSTYFYREPKAEE
ncbi:MAG: hypothetical protein ACI9MR_000658 [Myxococcota bacterium]|jgi:hypothetical protein